MKQIIVILFVLITQVVLSQNLVPNGSFENYSTCPSASGQLTLAINWYNPSSYGSPDYFNVCSSTLGVPKAGSGFQYPKNGNAMAGIWAFSLNINNTREYIQTQLTNTLINGNYYLIEYNLNRSNWSHFACNNLSCLISNIQPLSTGAHGLMNEIPQISKFENNYISDTLNWVKVSGIYIAIGGENFITIGNFKDDMSTGYILAPGLNTNDAAYYYLDDVSMTHITTPQWQYRDTTVYLGDSVLIGPAITGLNINWYDAAATFIKNDPGIYVKPALTTTYLATENFNNATYNHTVTVTVLAPNAINEYEQLQNSVSLFPNPTAGSDIFISIVGSNTESIEVIVASVSGTVISKEILSLEGGIAKLTTALANGVYLITITNQKSKISVIKKLVIQK